MTLCTGATWMTSHPSSTPLLPALTPVNPCYLTPLLVLKVIMREKAQQFLGGNQGWYTLLLWARNVVGTKFCISCEIFEIKSITCEIRTVITCIWSDPPPSAPGSRALSLCPPACHTSSSSEHSRTACTIQNLKTFIFQKHPVFVKLFGFWIFGVKS